MPTFMRRLLAGSVPMVVFLASSSPSRGASAAPPPDDSRTLTEQLREKAQAASAKTPKEKKKIMEGAIEELRASHIVEGALKVGQKMPEFTLPDASGHPVSSKKLLARGPLVVVFYRGGWCPYCNLQLHDLQKHLARLRELGADLVAISPQTPDASLSTAQKAKLEFHVLSDSGNQVARKFGLVYKVPASLKELYLTFGIDLDRANGDPDWELPVSATYVVRPDGRVDYAFLDPDYKKRAETNDVLARLAALRKKTAPPASP